MTFAIKVDRKEDIAALTPEQVRKGLAERAEKLHLVFEEAGATLDPSKVKIIEAADGQALAKQIDAMNDEMSWFGERATALDKLDSVKAEAERNLKYSKGYSKDPSPFAPKEGDPEKPRKVLSLGQAFAKSPLYEAAKRRSAPASMVIDAVDAKQLIEMKATFATSAGWAPENMRTGRIALDEQREIEVTDAIPLFPTSQAAIVYMEETTFTNNAAERAEEGAYAESALALTERSSTVRSIGSRIPITDEQLEDVEGAAAYIDQRLTFMVRQRLDGQIIAGSGVAPNLTGTLNVGSINTQAKGADPVPDAVYKGADLVRTTGRAIPNVVFAHPTDWQAVRLLRTADGIYIWGSPSESGPARIWGLPVILTTAMTQNTMLVGDYARHSGLFVRQGVEVQTGYVNDDFANGRVTVRAGLRVALVHFRAPAFTQVTGV